MPICCYTVQFQFQFQFQLRYTHGLFCFLNFNCHEISTISINLARSLNANHDLFLFSIETRLSNYNRTWSNIFQHSTLIFDLDINTKKGNYCY